MMAQVVSMKDQELGCAWLKVLAQGLQASPKRAMANGNHTRATGKSWDGHG